MKAFADWGKAVEKGMTLAEKDLARAAKKATALKNRAAKTLARVKRAKTKELKSAARDAHKLVRNELAAAKAVVTGARESHASAKAAKKLFSVVEKSLANGIKSAEKAVAKAAKPKRRRRFKKLIA